MKTLMVLALLTQAPFVPPPSPPALAFPGSEVFRAEQLQFENELRHACISERGIRILIDRWTTNRTTASARNPSWQQLEIEVAKAAYAEPVDMKQFESAMRAKAAARANDELKQAEDAISVLQKLPAKDRVIYARRYTWMQPATPAPRC
ncbi:MAG: hypothetical protein ACKOQ3_08485 [Novosphingobium sp.]